MIDPDEYTDTRNFNTDPPWWVLVLAALAGLAFTAAMYYMWILAIDHTAAPITRPPATTQTITTTSLTP